MRILALNWRDLAHPSAGGAEVYLESVLARWAREHEVTLFTAAVDGAPAEEVRDGYTIVRRGSRLSVYRQARRWWRSHGRGRFDVVLEVVNTVPFLAHEWVDVPTVALVHQTCEEIWGHNASWPASVLGRHVLEPWWLRRLGRAPVLAVSDSTRVSLARFGVHDVTVVPEGYEPSLAATAQAGAPKEMTPTVVWCARLVDYKRPADAVRAVELARRSIPGLQAWMIGGGPMLEQLRRTAPPGVVFTGRVDEETKHNLMARAHAHLATSVREGWGLVVSEAAALGTPTISYDVPGLRDSVAAADGVLCEQSPAAMAAAVVEHVPRWIAEPLAPTPHGGACSWDDVARELVSALHDRARLPGGQPGPHENRPATRPAGPSTTRPGTSPHDRLQEPA